MPLRLLQFLAVILTVIAFAPSAAHLFELPHKIGLAETDYFTVQGIYRGWDLFGLPLIAALMVNLWLAIRLRHRRPAAIFATLAFVGIGLSLAIFFTWTWPANVATANWTVVPENWADLRTAWEYSHAVNALVMFLAVCSVTLAGLWGHD
jgi:hypothetical protein